MEDRVTLFTNGNKGDTETQREKRPEQKAARLETDDHVDRTTIGALQMRLQAVEKKLSRNWILIQCVFPISNQDISSQMKPEKRGKHLETKCLRET